MAMTAFAHQRLTGPELWAIGVALAAAFLLREANLLFSLAFVPLLFLVVRPERRFSDLARVYGPPVAMFLVIGFWNVYRCGSFVITTGAQFNPLLAMIQVDKTTPIFDQLDNPIDRSIRRGPSEFGMEVLYRVNEEVQAELGIQAPQFAGLMLKRYVSAWLNHPSAMLGQVTNNWEGIKSYLVSSFVYDNPSVPPATKDRYRAQCEEVVIWGLIVLPLAWLMAAALIPALRRRALIVFSLWLFSAGMAGVYAAMWFEARYILPITAPILTILALSAGVVVEAGARMAQSLSKQQWRFERIRPGLAKARVGGSDALN